MDEEDRPSFLTMYFEEPDAAMHANGPDSDGPFALSLFSLFALFAIIA